MTYFKANTQGIGELLISTKVAEMTEAKGLKVLAAAKASAPDAPPYGVGYIDSFELETDIQEAKTRRARTTVRNTSRHSIYVEFGGSHDAQGHRTLGKALDAAK